jgi:hypothetical protein
METMVFRLPGPSALVDLTRSVVGQVVGTAAAVATVPVRAMSLLGQAELLLSRVTVIAGSAEALVDRVSAVVTEAEEAVRAARSIAAAAALTVDEAATVATAAARVVERADAVAAGAGRTSDDAARIVAGAQAATAAAAQVVAQAEAATAEAIRLLDGYAPTLHKAAPLAARFVGELTPEEVTAAIRMVDELPRLRRHLVDDVMPLLGKLDQVGPDLHALLSVTEDLHLAIAGLPGLKMLRRRGEERVAEDGAATNGHG